MLALAIAVTSQHSGEIAYIVTPACTLSVQADL